MLSFLRLAFFLVRFGVAAFFTFRPAAATLRLADFAAFVAFVFSLLTVLRLRAMFVSVSKT
jgi:hypothetical protein